MNRQCLTIGLALFLGGIGIALLAPRNSMSIPVSGWALPCTKPSPGFEQGANLLRYYTWLHSAPIDEKKEQYLCVSSSLVEGNARAKLVLALILVTSDTPFKDFARAKVLLGEYLQHSEKEEPEDRSLASLLLTLLDEVARLEEQLEQLKAIERDITKTEQSVNVPTPAPAEKPENEREKDNTSGR